MCDRWKFMVDNNNPCKLDEQIAEDGLCRKKDVNIKYQGCSFDKPLLCSNGKCVESLSECAGYSSCENVE